MYRADQIPLPPHAYVPGETPRHDEAVFAPFHTSLPEGGDIDALAHSLSWQAAWIFLEQGYYWEAHELLEPIWMQLPAHRPERAFVQAMIQTANALLKQKMQRPRAVSRLCEIVESQLGQCAGQGSLMGKDPARLAGIVQSLR